MIKFVHICITQYAKPRHRNERQMARARARTHTHTHTHTSQCMNWKMLTVLWNQAVHTDREVTANWLDILIKNKKEKTCVLIDVAISADRNVVKKEAEKKLKYKSLSTQIQLMWNMRRKIIPVLNGATRTVTEGLKKNLEAMPGIHSIDSLQKTVILGTSHIIRKVLQSEMGNLSVGDHRWFRRNARKKRSVTRENNNNNNNNMIIIMAASSRFTYAMRFSVRIPSGFPWGFRMIDRITPGKTGLFSVRN